MPTRRPPRVDPAGTRHVTSDPANSVRRRAFSLSDTCPREARGSFRMCPSVVNTVPFRSVLTGFFSSNKRYRYYDGDHSCQQAGPLLAPGGISDLEGFAIHCSVRPRGQHLTLLCGDNNQAAHLSMKDSMRSSFCVGLVEHHANISTEPGLMLTAPVWILCSTAKPHLTLVRFVRSLSIRLPTSR